jgi:threonine synthase
MSASSTSTPASAPASDSASNGNGKGKSNGTASAEPPGLLPEPQQDLPLADSHAGLDVALLDGATAHEPHITPALEAQRRAAADLMRPLSSRLEAYEDIFESEVGDTGLTRARNLERDVGLRQLYVKFEGGNPTGTQKDRIAFSQAMDALRRGFTGVTVATCGNYGAAVALGANLAGLRCVVHIPESYHTRRIQEMTALGAQIIRVPGDYEAALKASRLYSDKAELYDANPGGANTTLQLKAYGEIAYEIYDELRDAPAAVAVPVSNGTTLAGIYRGFLSLYRRGKTSRIPKMVAGSAYQKNPIIRSFLKPDAEYSDIEPKRIKETLINEPLINWHAEDGPHALEALRESKGFAGYVTDKLMISFAKLIREREGLSVLPASTAGLVALLDRHRKEVLPGDRYVVILTGRKS